MRTIPNASLRLKAGLHLLVVVLIFVGYLGGSLWLMRQPTYGNDTLRLFSIGSAVAGIFGLALLYVLIDKHIIQPLVQLIQDIQQVARGDFDTSITVYESADEVGALSRSAREMKSQLVARIHEAERFEQGINYAGHAIYITDADGVIEYVNPSFEDITKYSAAEAIGQTPSILKSGQQSESYYDELWGTILDGDVWEDKEIINRRKNGELFYADETIAPITDRNDELVGFVATMIDRTEQQIHQQQTQALSRVLRHNLRTRLNLIDGYASEILAADDPSTCIDYAQDIRTQARRMVELGNKANQTVKKVADTVQEDAVSVSETIESVAAAQRRRFPEATIKTDVPPSQLAVVVDIETVLEELVENALEHNDQARPKVTIRVSNQRADSTAPTVRITIEDNGPGIPRNERRVLREGEETPLLHGSGLGLWMVYWIVTRGGGDISIEERDSRGTRVILRLPQQSAATPHDTCEH